MADGIYGFGKKDVKRIGDVVRRIEQQPYPGNKRPGGPTPWNYGTIEAIVTTTITAFTNGNYGQGVAQPQLPVFNSNTNTYQPQADNSFSNGNTNTVVVVNFSQNSNSINTNTHIGISWRNGVFELAWADC